MFERLIDKKIVVTGGTGFIGRKLVESLLKAGGAPIVLTRQRRCATDFQAAPKIEQQPRFVNLDLLEKDVFEDFLKKERPDIIFHLAGTTGRNALTEDYCHKVNFETTERLLTTVAEFGCERIVLTGSADEYGHGSGPQNENAALNPLSPYAVSKARATELAMKTFAIEKLPITILRLFSVYGVGQPSQMFVAQAIDCGVRNVPFKMTSGAQKRDLVYLDDVVKAYLAVFNLNSAAGGVINIGTGTATALSEVAKTIWNLTGAPQNFLEIGARPCNLSETHDTWADVSLAKKLLGWQAQTKLVDGLTQIIEVIGKQSKITAESSAQPTLTARE